MSFSCFSFTFYILISMLAFPGLLVSGNERLRLLGKRMPEHRCRRHWLRDWQRLCVVVILYVLMIQSQTTSFFFVYVQWFLKQTVCLHLNWEDLSSRFMEVISASDLVSARQGDSNQKRQQTYKHPSWTDFPVNIVPSAVVPWSQKVLQRRSIWVITNMPMKGICNFV